MNDKVNPTSNYKKKHTILWADDDPDDLMLINDVLRNIKHNADVVEVNNGQEALNYLDEARKKQSLPCLIILDMNMPVLNGKQTLVHIKGEEDLKDIPTVIFTTSNSEMDRMFCKQYGAEMITKPPKFSSLTSVIEKMLSLCQILIVSFLFTHFL